MRTLKSRIDELGIKADVEYGTHAPIPEDFQLAGACAPATIGITPTSHPGGVQPPPAGLDVNKTRDPGTGRAGSHTELAQVPARKLHPGSPGQRGGAEIQPTRPAKPARWK